jgi:hypothetical protein
MQMPLAEAMALLGVPADYSRDDVIRCFRRAAMKAHPDQGGTAEMFRELVEARDRLLAAREMDRKLAAFATSISAAEYRRMVAECRPRQHPERELQCGLAEYLRWRAYPDVWWTCFPAGERRDASTGALLQRMGLKAGIPPASASAIASCSRVSKVVSCSIPRSAQ